MQCTAKSPTILLVLSFLWLIPGIATAIDSDDDYQAVESGDMGAARAAVSEQDYTGAIEILTAVVRDDRENADAFNLLGYSYRKLGQLLEARRNYIRALRIDPAHLGALEYQGELFLTIDEPAKAQANLDKLKELCGSDCEEYLTLKASIDASG